MARTFGRILTSCQNDPDFQTLSESAQRLYWLLLAQKDLNTAGMLSINYSRWARACAGTSVDRVREVAKELNARRYVLLDEDTEEAFVRSLMRNDEIVKQPQLIKNALKVAPQTDSPFLRYELAAELRRLGRDDAAAVADAIDPGSPNPPSDHGSPIQADASPTEARSQADASRTDGSSDGGGVATASGVGVTSQGGPVSSSSDPDEPESDVDPEPTPKTKTAPPPDEPQRDDVDAICFRLRDWMVHNEAKEPTIGKRWKRQARLLLDQDKRELSKALNLIDWCQTNSFWKGNIHSTQKFREKYDQLAIQAREEWRRNGGRLAVGQVPEFIPDDQIDPDAILGPDYWAPPAPPEDVDNGPIEERRAWFAARKGERHQQRVAEARAAMTRRSRGAS